MPTNEAMRAAEHLAVNYILTTFDKAHTADVIDRETNLPALLAVAEAAREYVGFFVPPGSAMDASRSALRAALSTLPNEETGHAD